MTVRGPRGKGPARAVRMPLDTRRPVEWAGGMTAIGQAGARPGAGWDVLASDGSVIRIRPLRENDEPALDAMNDRVSDRSIYLRFFGISRLLAEEHTHHLATAHDGHVALVA